MSFARGGLTRKVSIVLVAALMGALAIPALAGAQQGSPTTDQYDTSAEQVGAAAGTGGPSATEAPSDREAGLSGRVGPLPFTGFDVIAMIAVALAVTGLGLALQRAVSRPPDDELT